jgi:putative ATPase
MGLKKAEQAVRDYGDAPVPLHLRNAPTGMMKEMGYGEGYRYAHDFERNFAAQEYMPERMTGIQLYEPGKNVREEELRTFLQQRWKDKYGY